MIKKCKHCGNEFEAKYKGKLFCTKACYGLWSRRRITKKCLICGELFESFPSKENKFCSQKCFGLSERTDMILECKFCKKPFTKKKWERKIYCSQLCGAEAKKIRPKITCLQCGEEFNIPNYRLGKTLFCSRKCSNDHAKTTGRLKIGSDLIEKTCEFCNASFFIHPYRKDSANFCSKKCHYMSKNITKKCLNCDNMIIKPNWLYNSGYTEKFCEECRMFFSPKKSFFEIDVKLTLKKIFNDIKYDIMLKDSNRKCFPDIVIGNLVIECNGDYWHCNPKLFDEIYFHKQISMYSCDIWKRDKERVDFIERCGYNVYVIWESDWSTQKTKIIKEIQGILKCNIKK